MNKQTARLLEQHFDTAFDTPDGIKKLRELILTLAIQGKLVPQDPNDQPASELLKEIAAEKASLIKEGKLKQQKPLPPIDPKEIPYEIPASWQWCFLENICSQITDGTHHTPNYQPSGVPFISVKDLSSGKLDFSSTKFISLEEHEELKKRCYPEKGDILLTKVGTTGIAVEVQCNHEFSLFVSVALLKVFSKKIFTTYLTFLINSPLVRKFSADATEGVGNKNMVLRKIKNFLMPIPPLTEQKRIVARVDQLMARCDELEKMRDERDIKCIATHAAAVNQLLSAPDSDNFNTAWKFIKQNFDELYSVNENVAELRKAILQLAVMGKLVPQDPTDQSASELLKEIAVEKARLIEAGKIKPQKPLPPIKPEEIPFKIPANWQWSRLDSISIKIHYGYTASADFDSKQFRLLRITDIQNNKVDWESVPGCDIKEKDVAQYLLNDNDILIARTGGTVGKTYLVKNLTVNAVFASYLIRVVPSSHINPDYLKYFAECPLYWSQLYSKCSGTGQPNVNGASLSTLILTIPPLAEQKRIVARVDQLMALCDNLEQNITAAADSRTILLNAMMSKI